MATGDAYSRSILVAKIVLPLIALGILSTLFLVSGEIDPEAAIPYAKVDVTEIAREQRLTNARYATVDADGAAIELAAAVARPDPDEPDRIEAEDVTGTIELPGGARIGLRAGGAVVDMLRQLAGLTDDVLVTSTAGYRVMSDRLLARMDAAELNSEGPVHVETPFGRLEAGNMRLIRDSEGDGSYRMLFTERVRLLYLPQVEE